MEIREQENFNGTGNPSASEDYEGDEPYHTVRNSFKRASSLLSGKFPNAPKPFQMYASTITAYHLASKPTMMNITIDKAVELYKLGDFQTSNCRLPPTPCNEFQQHSWW